MVLQSKNICSSKKISPRNQSFPSFLSKNNLSRNKRFLRRHTLEFHEPGGEWKKKIPIFAWKSALATLDFPKNKKILENSGKWGVVWPEKQDYCRSIEARIDQITTGGETPPLFPSAKKSFGSHLKKVFLAHFMHQEKCGCLADFPPWIDWECFIHVVLWWSKLCPKSFLFNSVKAKRRAASGKGRLVTYALLSDTLSSHFPKRSDTWMEFAHFSRRKEDRDWTIYKLFLGKSTCMWFWKLILSRKTCRISVIHLSFLLSHPIESAQQKRHPTPLHAAVTQ